MDAKDKQIQKGQVWPYSRRGNRNEWQTGDCQYLWSFTIGNDWVTAKYYNQLSRRKHKRLG